MLSAEQKAIRRTGITATDAAALSGEHPWWKPFDVYGEKIGESKDEDTVRTLLGHAAEPVLMGELAKARQLNLVPATTERHPIFDWVISTPDRDVIANDTRIAVAEAKLVMSPFVLPHWSDEHGAPCLPGYVHAQVQWQMVERRVRLGYVAAFLAGADELQVFEVQYNDDLAGALLEIGDAFWTKHVLKRTPPDPDGSESARRMLARAYPRPKSTELIETRSVEVVQAVSSYLIARAEEKRAKAAKDLAGNQLRALIGDGAGYRSVDFQTSWATNSVGVPMWRAIAIEAGATPELIAKHTPAGERVLRVALRSKDKKEAV